MFINISFIIVPIVLLMHVIACRNGGGVIWADCGTTTNFIWKFELPYIMPRIVIKNEFSKTPLTTF